MLFDVLGDDMPDNEVGFAGTGGTDYQQGPEWIDYIDPTGSSLAPQVIGCRQIN